MQRYTIFFITLNVLHVSGGFSAHHQELKNCTHSIGYLSSLLAVAVSVGESKSPKLTVAASYILKANILSVMSPAYWV
jgi:hypothetical protein